MSGNTIEIRNLSKVFPMKTGFLSLRSSGVHAIDDLSMDIRQGEIIGLVGESGSGKTTLARVILGLTKATSGTVTINGQDITKASGSQLKKIRRDIAVVFQDPASNLNPRQTVEQSIMRPMIIHGVPRKEAEEKAREAMSKVKMDELYLSSYPHQLSGGQLQRIAIARALVMDPKVMILDEPTSALDISIQAQVLNLLIDIQEESGLTYLIITHDLNVVRYISDRTAVMYLGKLVEFGDTETVFHSPKHPYTRGLMAAAPVIHPSLRERERERLKGEPGSLLNLPQGCRLCGRCPFEDEECREKPPEMREVETGHFCACCKV